MLYTNSFICFLYQTCITEFCQEFVTMFSDYSPSKCKIPKLHVLRYHVIPSIRFYGSMNGMSTETYETLHKSNVKNPYRMTNKKNISHKCSIRYISVYRVKCHPYININ